MTTSDFCFLQNVTQSTVWGGYLHSVGEVTISLYYVTTPWSLRTPESDWSLGMNPWIQDIGGGSSLSSGKKVTGTENRIFMRYLIIVRTFKYMIDAHSIHVWIFTFIIQQYIIHTPNLCEMTSPGCLEEVLEICPISHKFPCRRHSRGDVAKHREG